MPTQDELIALHLQQSLESGELSKVEGFGRPLADHEGWNATPVEFRMPFRILKNAGCTPPEVEWFRQRAALNEALAGRASESESAELKLRLVELERRIQLRLEALRTNRAL